MKWSKLRSLATQWPLALAIAFCVYAYALLIHAYRTQDSLKTATEQRIVADAKREAVTMADLITERRNASAELAASPEVANFFANRALGMSLRYGLGVNLSAIEDRFRQRLHKTDVHGEPLFQRLALLDNDGKIVVDSDPSGGSLPLLPKDKMLVEADTQTQKLSVSAPVVHNGTTVGQLVASGDLSLLSRNLVTDTMHHEFIVANDGRLLTPIPLLGNIFAETLNEIATLPENRLFHSDVVHGGILFADDYLLLRTLIPNSNFSLIHCYSRDSIYGQLTSPYFFYSASIFPLILLLAAYMSNKLRRFEQALAQSEKRFKIIVDNIRDAIVIVDGKNGNLVEANPAACEMYGYAQAEIPELNAPQLNVNQPPYDLEQWSFRTTAALTGTPQFFEWRARRKNQDVFWVEISLLAAEINGLRHLLMVARDISGRKEQEFALIEALDAQKKLNRKLEEAQNQLLQSEKMASIGQLAAGVAHEINNPIGFVTSNVGTLQVYIDSLLQLVITYEKEENSLPIESRQAILELKRKLDLGYLREDIGTLMTETREGLERVRRIVADLKDFSHVDKSELQLASLEKGLDSTINVVWNELKYKAEVVREYTGIPEIQCFAPQLNQVFMNLLVNAAQAMTGMGRITIRTGHDDQNVWVEIEDTGAGIPEEIRSRIFEPFFTTKPVGQGTGLGLSLSYGIVRKHGGQIDVCSTQDVGTTFRITLPREPSITPNEDGN